MASTALRLFALCMCLALTPGLSLSLSSTVSYPLGQWTVSVTNESDSASPAQGVSVSVFHSANPTLPMWETTPEAAIVVGQKVNMTISQFGGIFNVTRDILTACTASSFLRSVSFSNNVLELKGPLEAPCSESDWFLSFTPDDVSSDCQHLTTVVGVSSPDSSLNAVTVSYGTAKDAAFMGFGHQYTFLNMATKRFPVLTMEQGVGRGAEPATAFMNAFGDGGGGNAFTTYTSNPLYVSSENRSVIVTSPEYMEADLSASQASGIVAWHIQSPALHFNIVPGTSPKSLITSLTAYTGRFPELPSWVNNGAILGLEGGTDHVTKVVQQAQAHNQTNPPIAGVWLQDWSGERNFSGSGELPRVGLWWNWEVDASHYPNWPQFINDLRAQDIRVLVYINPMFKDITARGTPYHHNFFKEALALDYLVRLQDGSVWEGYGGAGLMNLTNPDAVEWFQTHVIKEQILDANLSGWMNDFGESFPFNAQYQPEHSADALHSQYPYMWSKLNADIVASEGLTNDVAFFSRSASTRSPSAGSLMWLGDQLVVWDEYDGLKTAVIGLLSAGYSGLSLAHSDIGGYTTLKIPPFLDVVRSAELLARWCEVSAFNVMYRSHPGSLPSADAQFYTNATTLDHYLRMARVFRAWGFYRMELIKEAHTSGLPVVRHTNLEFPSIPPSVDLSLQFLVGTCILVAPVTDPGNTTARVYLPRHSSWSHVWSGKAMSGDDSWVTVDAPVGQPAVFVRTDVDKAIGVEFITNLKNEGVLL